MLQTNAFTIYNASAGSGKTYTLVKEYLKLVLRSKQEGSYKNLLAITFTNKAVTEMKQRIVKNLVLFSNQKAIEDPPDMLFQIAEEINLSIGELHRKAKKALKHLLHHYANFHVETIDRFNHQLIRTFARDLKLPQNFEVTLEVAQLVAEAVDRLINKAGEDPEITKILLDFALEKTDDDKSWDIAKDITQAAQILLNENDTSHVAKLKDKSLKDFAEFKKKILVQKKDLVSEIVKIASETLQLIEESGLQFDDFSGSYMPVHYKNLTQEKFNINFNTKWQESMGSKPLYPKRVDASIASVIDELTPVFIANFAVSKQAVHQLLLMESILKNITPLSVINLVNQELETIKKERGLLPISEFNALINNEIKNQPAPFIYERLGEKYRHFFIDEFQDTSIMQWQNLIPLVDNALSQQTADGEQGSLLLVGDAKQSIYRWRGGDPGQFMSLSNGEIPFSVKEKLLNLETNYRSCKEIIAFNNAFFSYTASLFGNTTHNKLYAGGNQQLSTAKEGGYVKFEFISRKNNTEAHLIYADRVYQTILQLLDNGFEKKDICILTRKKIEGISLGAYLMSQGISIVSSETLLLQYSLLVQSIVNTLTLHLYPENEAIKIELLGFLHTHFQISEAKHTFFNQFLNTSNDTFEQTLKDYQIDFSFAELRSLSIYESCEYIIKHFQLNIKPDGYLFGFMDLVFEFQQQPQAGKLSFLNFWETKKDTASIPASQGSESVQLMTIHKSKGLEFPVVLFPFADVEIYKEQNAKAWFPWNDEVFDEVRINYNKNVAEFGETGASMSLERRNLLELDNINLLYVTLTRAIEQLYVFASTPSAATAGKPASFNQLFGEFLKSSGSWNEESLTSEFGTSVRVLEKLETKEAVTIKQLVPEFITTLPKEHDLKIVSSEAFLWETEAGEAITIGNLLHDTMELIKTENNVETVFQELEMRSVISSKELLLLRKTANAIVKHPELNHLFKIEEENVVNERDIITANGKIIRPDRLIFKNATSVSIIDYKTGVPKEIHEAQLNEYASALEEMNFSISEKILVYTSEEKIMINKI